MVPGLPNEEFAAALDACAAELLWEAEFAGPPADAFRLAHQLGLVVSAVGDLGARAHYARVSTRHSPPTGEQTGLVLLADDPRPERRHWAVAHEIGEFAAHRVFAHLGVSPLEAPPTTRERIANCLASRLLLPEAWFLADARQCDWDLLMLKQVYPTASHELIARRVLELFPGAAIVSVLDQGEVTWRRANADSRRHHSMRPSNPCGESATNRTSQHGQKARRNTSRTSAAGQCMNPNGGGRFC